MLLCPFCQSPVEDRDSWFCPRCGRKPEQKGCITFLSPDATHANFPDEAFTVLSAIEDGHFWFEGRNRLITSILKRYVQSFSRYLEVGCGTGFVLREIADVVSARGGTVCGSEFFQPGLEIAAVRVPQARLFQMDAHSIPFREEFDLLGAFDVLEHIEDDKHVLNEMAKALKPGGHVLITVPQHAWMWSNSDVHAGHVRRYSKKDLVDKLESAGFKTVKATSFVSLLLPCMYVFRLISRGNSGLSATHGLMNTLFSAIMRFEGKLIAAGVCFPAGGSLLVLAKRQ